MYEYKVNKTINCKPQVFGLSQTQAYIFFVIGFLDVFFLISGGLTFIKFAVFVGILVVSYLALSLFSEENIKKIIKKRFADPIDVIKVNSIKAFKDGI